VLEAILSARYHFSSAEQNQTDFVLLIPQRNQNLYTSEPFLKVLPFGGFISHAMLDLGFPFLTRLLSVRPPFPSSHLPSHGVNTARICSLCTAHATRAFPPQWPLPQLPSKHLPGGKPAASETTEGKTVVSKDTAK